MMRNILIFALPVLGGLLGLFFALRPSQMIEIQRRFYEKINWKIEPINFTKEIRNTRLMGITTIVLSLLALVILLFRKPPI